MANTIDLVLKATNQASPAINTVARELGTLDLAGRKAAGGGLADMGKAIPQIAESLLSMGVALPGLPGALSAIAAVAVGAFNRWVNAAELAAQKTKELGERVQATFEETQAEVNRIRAEAAGDATAIVEQQYARELAQIEKSQQQKVKAAKGSAEEISAIEAEMAGKRLIAAERLEAELAALTHKRVDLARQMGEQVRAAETAVTVGLLEESGKRLQALEVGAGRQVEILRTANQKQLEEIKKLGGTEQEQYELRRQAQEVFAAQSLQLTTETEIKRRAILKEQSEFLKGLAKSAGEAEASLAVAVLESQGKHVAAVEAAAAQRKAVLDAEYQATLERIAKQGLTEQQALEARLNAERSYHAQSRQLALDTATRKTQLAEETAAKEAQAAEKAAAAQKAAIQAWLENLKLIKAAQEMVVASIAAVADADAKATAAVLEGQDQRLEALETTSARQQAIIEETYLAEIKKANETAMLASQRLQLKLNAEKKYAADSIALSTQTEQARRQIVESSVSAALSAFQRMGAGFEAIQSKLTMVTFIQETQKGIAAFLELGKAIQQGDTTLAAAGLTAQDVARAIAGLTGQLTTAIHTGIVPGTQALEKQNATLTTMPANWAAVGSSIGGATAELQNFTAWSDRAMEAANKVAQSKMGTVSTPLPSHIKTAQEALNWMKSGQASITPQSQFGSKTEKPATTLKSSSTSTNNVNVNVGSVNDKTQIQQLTNAVMQAIADAERRRTG